MKKIYETPQLKVVKLRHAHRLMVGSDPEEPGGQGTGPDEDVPGL